MDLQLALAALAALVVGSVLTAAALWCRAGAGPGARFWVRRSPFEQRQGLAYGETVMLVVVPLVAQLLIVVGLLMAITAIDTLRQMGLGPLYAAAVIGETILWVLLLLAVGYRTVMPLWVYPSWLRPVRRQERDRIRSR